MELLPEIARQRLQKIKDLRAEGVCPFVTRFDRSHGTAQILETFSGLAVGEHASEEVRVAGRLLTFRAMGKTAFAHLGDQDGKIQIYLQKDALGEEKFKWAQHRLDLGDILGVKGPVFRTKTGELTVQVKELTLLTKTVMPPP
jgi:lysyl-tRNA synthetase, class II